MPRPIAWKGDIITIAVVTEEEPTRPTRFASGFAFTYSVSVPFGIHSNTNCIGVLVTPMKGTIFGCPRLFHMMASLKNAYVPTRDFQWAPKRRFNTNYKPSQRADDF